ncbi:MAG: hypothetical protein GY716_07270 [bacterium]|nr:hypothetical protein [bacterium]
MKTRIETTVPALLILLALCVVPATGGEFPEAGPEEDVDVRRESLAESGSAALRAPTAPQVSAAARWRRERPDLELRWDGMSGAPRSIAAGGRALTAPDARSPAEIVAEFVGRHAELFGLLSGEIAGLVPTSSVPAAGGGTHLYFKQTVGGIDVDQGRLNATVSARGELVSIGARLFAGIAADATPALGATAAVSRVASRLYPELEFSGDVRAAVGEDAERKTTFDEAAFGRAPQARLVHFPLARGSRLAWEVRIGEPSLYTDYVVLIDAATGDRLARRNLTAYAEGRVLQRGSPEPEYAEFEQSDHQLTIFPASTSESPLGWISGAGTALEGNNAVSHLGTILQPGLTSPTGVYDHPFNTTEAALANAWFWVNDAHDRFYAAGFDEAAGNFQTDNFAQGGLGGDAIELVAAPAQRTPFFTATVDGEPPQLSFGWIPFGGCRFCGDHDGYPENGGDRSYGFSRERIVHEYTHGVLFRRVGGPADVSCLTAVQSREMAEGWSLFFPASFYDDPTFGDFESLGMGHRGDALQDLTLEDFVYYGGWLGDLFWAGTLWDLRRSFVAADPSAGLDDLHDVVIESLALAPCNPSYLEARDALLAADTALFGATHHGLIWNVFAARGMGELASTIDENDSSPVADDTVPAAFVCAPPAQPTGLGAVVDGTNAVRLDYSAAGATSIEIWREDLDNPADAPELIATTLDDSTYVDTTVQGSKSYRYHVVALGDGGVYCRSAASSTADVTATGSCDLEFPQFIPNPDATDGDPSCEITLTWDPATPACPGSAEPIVYSIYRGETPGILPSDRTLVGRTASTSFADVPPDRGGGTSGWFDNATHYLVLAQHGTLDDPPDHRDRGSAQVMQWRGVVPTLGRTLVHSWDFEAGPAGWTSSDLGGTGPAFEWALVDPSPTWTGGALLAPDEAAGGSGMAWVTGDAAGPADSAVTNSCQELQLLTSPAFDASDGATIVSFDYWNYHTNLLSELYASMWLTTGDDSSGLGDFNSRDIGLRTVQRFNGPGRYGWQRFEMDLASVPNFSASTIQRIAFAGADCLAFSEYGIDNVRIEQATACSRSGLRLQSASIDDSGPGWGNGNGVLEPGEIARVSVDLYNDGTATAVTPVGSLRSPDPRLFVLDADAAFPNIPVAGTGSSTEHFLVALDDDTDCFGTVNFEFVFTDDGGARTAELWTPEVGEIVTDTLLDDDFESHQSWVISGNAQPGNGVWKRGDPLGATYDGEETNPDSCADGEGTLCYVTGLASDDPTKDDVDPGGDTILTSPSFNIDGYKRVRYIFDGWNYSQYNHEFGTGCCDGSGGLWSLLRDDDSERTIGSFNFGNQWHTYEAVEQLDPNATQGTDLRLSFLATDLVVDEIAEMAVDNVLIEGDLQVCTSNAVDPPNPVGPTVEVDKDGSDARLDWAVPAVDAGHDAAVFYRVYVSSGPSGGFATEETPTLPTATRSLGGATEYYLLSAANGGGTSGEDP